MGTQRIPKYCHHRGSGQAYVNLEGRDIYLGPHGTKASKEEYNRIIAEWLAGGRRLPNDPEEITIAELVSRFRTHAKTYYGPESRRKYLRWRLI